MKHLILPLTAISLMAACSSRPVLPDVEDVKVSRESPNEKCKEAGPVTGQTMKIKDGAEEALSDLKREAAAKGMNYVKIEQYSSRGSSVTGTGYICN